MEDPNHYLSTPDPLDDATPIEALQSHGLDPTLMLHIRGIANQLHEHGLLLQLVDDCFIVRDVEWVAEKLGIGATYAELITPDDRTTDEAPIQGLGLPPLSLTEVR